jgi:hypothetical protein
MHRLRFIGRPVVVAALVAAAAALLTGSAVATSVALKSNDETIHAGATKKTTVVRFEGPPQTTGSQTFQDIPGTLATITIAKRSILLVTLTAESSCFGGSGNASYCAVRILVDGVGELGPGLGIDFAFDSTNFGNDTQFSWEGHAMQRSSNVLPPGTYTVRPQYAAIFGSGPPAAFQIDDIHVTVEAVQA